MKPFIVSNCPKHFHPNKNRDNISVKASTLTLSGLRLLEPRIFRDERGFFFESYNSKSFAKVGITCGFVQQNHSVSTQHTIRGMHYQSNPGQAKLVRVVSGKIYDVALDIRPESPTFGKWEGVYLDAESHQQFFVPVGFAHGFCVVSLEATVLYSVSSLYDPKAERELHWNDPDIAIKWPTSTPLISDRDKTAPSFSTFRKSLEL